MSIQHGGCWDKLWKKIGPFWQCRQSLNIKDFKVIVFNILIHIAYLWEDSKVYCGILFGKVIWLWSPPTVLPVTSQGFFFWNKLNHWTMSYTQKAFLYIFIWATNMQYLYIKIYFTPSHMLCISLSELVTPCSWLWFQMDLEEGMVEETLFPTQTGDTAIRNAFKKRQPHDSWCYVSRMRCNSNRGNF